MAVPGVFRTQGLHEFIPAEWFRDPADSSGWVRIYSSLGLGHADFHKQMDAAFLEVQDCPFGIHQPVAVSYGQLAKFETSQLSWSFVAEEDGGTRCDVTIRNGKLPLGNYVVFVLPYRVDGVDGDATLVRAAMDQSVAAMIVHMGRNLLRDVVYEGEVNAGGVHRRPQLGIVPIPQAADGPYLEAEHWEDFCVAMQRLKLTRHPKRERIRLALEYLHEAVTRDQGFFEYWIALEILCNGQASAIAEQIKACSGFNSVQDVKDKTGFETLRRWRHDFFHEGKRPVLTAAVARYLQLLFLDLLRHQLSLPARRRALEFQGGNCDLSPLGLKDGRKSGADCGALPGRVAVREVSVSG